MKASLIWAGLAGAVLSTAAWGQTPPNPFMPPQAKAHFERDREYDLQNVVLRIRLQWKDKSLSGSVTHTLTPLRRLTALAFDAADALNVSSCLLNGRPVQFTHSAGKLVVNPGATALDRSSGPVTVKIAYALKPAEHGRTALNGTYGFHWVAEDKFNPQRRPAFWTQGESEGNRDWVPIYDYPNDKTTSEEYVEAPADWFVVGNGKLMGVAANPAAHTRTFHWKMTQPHATYLLSLAGGEMDVAQDVWQGVPLYYCVPKGEGSLIHASFADTKDMLTFFSARFGVKYAWPKYAQTAMFDFGGGMENVSATTLGEGSLVDPRDGFHPMASLNSHELAHQWFGDLITCKDWGNIWLNEGFATFCEQIYIEHSRGKDYYDREREGALQAYLAESRRYIRPIVTDYYPDPDSMFDSHTYPKGGLVLHMLRREMGDRDFFYGLGFYLRRHGYKPVDTSDLVRSLAEATGRNMVPFFEQWVYKPGHPVIDYSWSYDDAKHEVVADVSQLQELRYTVPTYDFNMPYATITNGQTATGFVHIDQMKQQLRISAAQKPDAFLLDPGHDILMERKEKKWQPGEKEAVLRYASSYLDRREAAYALLSGTPSEAEARMVMQETLRSNSLLLITDVTYRAATLKKPALRDAFREVARMADADVRAAGISGLGDLPSDPADVQETRSRVNDADMYNVVTNAMNALANWDAEANLELFRQQMSKPSHHEALRRAALRAISRSKSDTAANVVIRAAAPDNPQEVRETAVNLLGETYHDKLAAGQTVLSLIKDPDPRIASAAIRAVGARGDKSAVPALRDLQKSAPDAGVRDEAKRIADRLAG